MTATFTGFRLGLLRLRARRVLVAGVLAWIFVTIAALLERRSAPVGAVDRALAGATFGIAIPLVALLSMELVCASRRLDAATEVAGHWGANRRQLALGLLLSASLISVASAVLLGASTVLLTRSLSDPDLLRDILATSWIGGLAGVAYTGGFGLGSVIGRTGGGRFGVLALDWLIGASASAVALPFPRGPLKVLLLSATAGSVPAPYAVGLLAVFALACSLLACVRCPP
jgi:hypothetical protein